MTFSSIPLINTGPFETAINSTLRNFAADLRALENVLLKAAEAQPHEETLQVSEDAAEFFFRLCSTLREHVARLDQLIGERDEALPEPGTTSPFVANQTLPAKPGTRDACALFCDYYAQLNLGAAGYTMLHARSIALHHSPTAKLALEHLHEIIGLVHIITEIAPRLAVRELSRHFGGLIPGAAETAVRNTQEAWSQGSLAGSVH
jgi:hypothetical protein